VGRVRLTPPGLFPQELRFNGPNGFAINVPKYLLEYGDSANVAYMLFLKDNGSHPVTAGELADTSKEIPAFPYVTQMNRGVSVTGRKPQIGDVVAYGHDYSDATGHVVIFAGDVRVQI